MIFMYLRVEQATQGREEEIMKVRKVEMKPYQEQVI
jgi:hypothetical protein